MRVFRQPPVWSPLTLGALLSGFHAAWLGGGSRARRSLEAMLQAAYAPRRLYLTDSGTSALTMALRVVKSTTAAPVALPAYCCYDIATATDGADIPFLLYDLDPRTLSPDLASLRRAFELGARGVVVAHLYGVPADLGGVQALAAEFGAIVIEDAAQGSGCEWRGRPAGAHGALGVLSFGRGKGVTGGKGGALLVNDERLVAATESAWADRTGSRAPRGSLEEYVLLKAQWLLGRPALYRIPAALPFLGLGQTTYRSPGPVGGMSTLAAGVLFRTLPLAPGEVATRRANAAHLQATVRGVETFEPHPDWQAGWLRFPVVLQGTASDLITRDHVMAGVMPGYPRSLADLAGFASRGLNLRADFSGARTLAERLVTLPTHRFVRGAKIPAF